MSGNSRAQHIRALAGRMLSEAKITTPPTPVDYMLELQGLALTAGSLPAGSGFFDPGSWAVRISKDLFVESNSNRNRRRFTLAHELGHCMLEHGEQSCWKLGFTTESLQISDIDDFPDFEREAHHFAREILLPRALFDADWLQNQDADHIAREYQVSSATLFIVINERRLLMPRRKR